ncbi:MAG: YcgN family cysteine cluster protein [Thiothrix sp.]|nr:YcgN family cysteine cluster protein [Thiothrix sp.]
MTRPWWKQKALQDMSRAEWESLCDHCAKCCLNKLEDEEDGTVYYTDVACDLLEAGTCRCSDYANREVRVPDCLRLTPENLDQLYWMPPGCAYRLLQEGRDLPPWHHLVSGSVSTIHEQGESVAGRFVYSHEVAEEDWQERIVEWPLKTPD